MTTELTDWLTVCHLYCCQLLLMAVLTSMWNYGQGQTITALHITYLLTGRWWVGHLQWSSINISPTSRLCDSLAMVTADLCCKRSQADISMSVAALRGLSWRYWTNSSATPGSVLSQWQQVSSNDMLSNTVTICNTTPHDTTVHWVQYSTLPCTVNMHSLQYEQLHSHSLHTVHVP